MVLVIRNIYFGPQIEFIPLFLPSFVFSFLPFFPFSLYTEGDFEVYFVEGKNARKTL